MAQRWYILILIVFIQTSSSLLGQGLPALFVFLQADFDLSRAELGLFLAAMESGAVATFILGGWAADTLGVRRLIPLAQVLYGAVALAFSQAMTYHMGLAFLPVAGFALGAGGPALSMAVLFWFPARGRGTAMGVKQAGVPIAGMLAAAVLPSLALAYGWRTGVMLIGCINLALAVTAFLLYRDPPGAQPVRVLARPPWRQIGWLLRRRELIVINSFASIFFALQMIVNGYLILYLRDTLGLPIVAAGFVLAIGQAGAFCGRIAWGVFSDVFLRGLRVPALGLAGGMAAALVAVLALLPSGTPPWVLGLLAFALGFSAIGWHGLRHALLAELFPRNVAGTVLGVSQTMAEVGPILGPPLFGLVADGFGYRPAWLGLAALAFVLTVVLVRSLDERASAAAHVSFAAPAVVPAPPLRADSEGS